MAAYSYRDRSHPAVASVLDIEIDRVTRYDRPAHIEIDPHDR